MTKTIFQPINDNVLIKLLSLKSEIGIITPTSATGQIQKKGEVIGVGEEVDNLKVGDVVVFTDEGSIKLDDFLIVKQENIYGKEK